MLRSTSYLKLHHEAHDICFGAKCRDARLVANGTGDAALLRRLSAAVAYAANNGSPHPQRARPIRNGLAPSATARPMLGFAAAVGLVAADCRHEAASALTGHMAQCSEQCDEALVKYQHSMPA